MSHISPFQVGVGRFQINATAANNVNVPISPTVVDNVRRVMASLPSAEFILQRNSETQPLWAALEEVTNSD
jgi:adenine-specific DNA glycosylase